MTYHMIRVGTKVVDYSKPMTGKITLAGSIYKKTEILWANGEPSSVWNSELRWDKKSGILELRYV